MSNEPAETVAELKEQVKSAFSSRLRSPFVGVFIFSWIAWNHRLLFVLFADMRVGKRFDFIDSELYPTLERFVAYNLLWPMLSSLVYIMLVPWVTELVHRWNLWHQRRLREADLRSQNLDVLTEQQSSELRGDVSARNRLIDDLRQKLTRQENLSKMLAAMHGELINAASDKPQTTLQDYLLCDVFVTRTTLDMNADLSVHAFEEDGHVHSRGVSRGRAVKAENWRFDHKNLQLLCANGEVIASFRFNSANGRFEGQANNRETILMPRSL